MKNDYYKDYPDMKSVKETTSKYYREYPGIDVLERYFEGRLVVALKAHFQRSRREATVPIAVQNKYTSRTTKDRETYSRHAIRETIKALRVVRSLAHSLEHEYVRGREDAARIFSQKLVDITIGKALEDVAHYEKEGKFPS